MEKNKRIVIFNVNWLGDVLFSTAVIRNLRRNFPGSFIACIIPGRCYPVLKDNPHLDEIIIFDERERQKGMGAKFAFIQELKRRKFDTAVLLHGSLTRALLCRLAGIPERIGYPTKKRGFLLSKKIPLPEKNTLHRIDFYLNIIEKAGVRVEDRYPEFFFSEEDKKFAADFLKKHQLGKNDFLVGINPGGNWLPKRWPKEYWAHFADALISDFKAKLIITGGLTDLGLAKDIQALMREKAIIATGTFNLKQSAALFKQLDLFVCADSGPLHIANAVGTPKIIALFGPTDPQLTGPFPLKNVVILHKDVGCRIPCYVANCKDNRCMQAIAPQEIIDRVKLLIGS